jgi:hypothetical protein
MRSRLERHDHHPEGQPLDLVFVLSQLRQVLAAGQSVQVPVEDHQQPATPILLESMDRALRIRELERGCR